MSENSNPNHWADLLSQIGVPAPAEPPKKDESAAAEPIAKSPVAEPTRSEPQVAKPARRPAEVRRPTSNWDRLADDLGVPVPPRPAREVPAERPPRVEKPQPQAPAAKPVTHVEAAAEPETHEVARRETVFEGPTLEDAEPTPSEMWDTEIPELADPLFIDAPIAAGGEKEAGDVSADAAAGREQCEERERADRKRGRRRRRGRRKGSRPAESVADAPRAAVGERTESAPEDRSETVDSEPVSATEEGGTGPTEGRSRRRRRRRGSDRHRKPEAAETAEAGEPAGITEPEESTEAVEAWDAAAAADFGAGLEHERSEAEGEGEEWDGGVGDEAGDHGEDDDSDDPVATLSHRAIPTWEEAIKCVIAPNLEARAKHPNGGQQHRGGRRPRGDRSRRSN